MKWIQDLYMKIKGEWWFLLLVFVAALLVSNKVNSLFREQPHIPHVLVEYDLINTEPFVEQIPQDVKGAKPELIKLKYTEDKPIYGVKFLIKSQGLAQDENFEMSIEISDRTKIIWKDISYTPSILANRIVKEINKSNNIYRRLSHFQIGTEIRAVILTSHPISRDDLTLGFMGNLQNWPATEGKIDLVVAELLSEATAEASEATPANRPQSQLENDATKKKARSGILIGGYDPLVLANNVLKVLQNEKIISQREAQEIIDAVLSYRKGILIRGISFLRFNQEVLNLLIKKHIFKHAEAVSILEDAKKTGGVLFGGYNIVALEVGILNKLIQKGYLELSIGQQAVDTARPFRKVPGTKGMG